MGYEDVFKRGTAYPPPPLQFVLNMPSSPAHGWSFSTGPGAFFLGKFMAL